MISASFWAGRRVLLTGHTGFKGAWSAMLLRRLGADVHGLALPPSSEKGIFVLSGAENDVHHRLGDVCEFETVRSALRDVAPQMVLHMAAQSIVRESYADPLGTYATNVMGTVNLLQSVRETPSVQAVVVVTSDKCYDNAGRGRAHRETDPFGGYDPYSSSKGCAELVVSAYRQSFFSQDTAPKIASVRAGNVIGGGDWAQDRLVPDAMRAFFNGKILKVRNPHAVRPWQYVLDPIIAYLMLSERLVNKGREYAEAWNFGPTSDSEVRVADICERLVREWGQGATWAKDGGDHPRETDVLKLDSSKARERLGWRPLFDVERTVVLTLGWYKALRDHADMRKYTAAQIDDALSCLLDNEQAA